MGFNGKSLILIGIILFIFQIANFFSINEITPELEFKDKPVGSEPEETESP